jgi:hypothetical protein
MPTRLARHILYLYSVSIHSFSKPKEIIGTQALIRPASSGEILTSNTYTALALCHKKIGTSDVRQTTGPRCYLLLCQYISLEIWYFKPSALHPGKLELLGIVGKHDIGFSSSVTDISRHTMPLAVCSLKKPVQSHFICILTFPD